MRERNISQERKEYLRKIKKNKISVIVVQFLVLILFIVGWEILANKGIIDSFITSQPSRILDTFLNLSKNPAFFLLFSFFSLHTLRFLYRQHLPFRQPAVSTNYNRLDYKF